MFRPSGTYQCTPTFSKIPLKSNEFESVMFESNVFLSNSENEKDLYQKCTCQGISYVILNENSAGIIFVNVK